MNGNIRVIATAACCVCVAACAGTGPTAPSASTVSSSRMIGAEPQTLGGPSSPLAPNGGLTAPAFSEGMTDVTLANAGWTCIQPGNGLILCAPPGTGLPPIPPAADGQATYNLVAFTLDHQFVHRIKLLRPDLYHGQPCLGGDRWIYVDFLGYYECLIPE
jgi:hypothetical protein